MTIRPVDFNGMIQNSHDVTHAKQSEDNKAALQQQNIQAAVVKEEQVASTRVGDMEEAQQHEYNYGEGGGNGSYAGNKRKKKSKDKKKESEDGAVFIKKTQPSFDMKI